MGSAGRCGEGLRRAAWRDLYCSTTKWCLSTTACSSVVTGSDSCRANIGGGGEKSSSRGSSEATPESRARTGGGSEAAPGSSGV
eukprot:2344461-Rhodomonas_salina.1